MPWCLYPGLPPFFSPASVCPQGAIETPVQPGTSGGNQLNEWSAQVGTAAGNAAGQAAGAAVSSALGNQFTGLNQAGTQAGNLFSWLSSAEHWKGIGLLALAVVAGVVGLVLWTGKGGEAVQVSTSTGQRITNRPKKTEETSEPEEGRLSRKQYREIGRSLSEEQES